MIPQWREMGDIIGAHIESVFTGSNTAKDALDAAAAESPTASRRKACCNTPRQYEELFPEQAEAHAEKARPVIGRALI